MRLIDADAFEVVSLEGVTEEFAEGAKYVLELLDKAPTIRVRKECMVCRRLISLRKAGYRSGAISHRTVCRKCGGKR